MPDLLQLRIRQYKHNRQTDTGTTNQSDCDLDGQLCKRKHGALHPQKPLRLIRDGEVGGSGILYTLLATLSSPEQFCIEVGSCASHFNVPLIVWAKSQDSVHKAQFSKRKEIWSGSKQGPSAYQPSALPLGHTGSQSYALRLAQLYTLYF